MGGGISSSAESSESLSEDDLKHLLISYSSDEFISKIVYESSILFYSLCDLSSLSTHNKNKVTNTCDTPTINSMNLSTILNSSHEQEAFKIFLTYCPIKSYEMFCDPYLNFCKDLKLLSRHYFTKQNAITQFSQNSVLVQQPFINYNIFRYKILPFISKTKNITIYDLILRISRLEPNLITPSTTILTEVVATEEGNKDNDEEKESNPKKDYAALQIQKLHRYRTARLDLNHMKSLRSIESHGNLLVLSSKSNCLGGDAGEDLERKVKSIFEKYSGLNHEMNLHEFLKLCHDTELIPYGGGDKVDLTKREAKYIFQSCIALYFDPATNTYGDGVIHGKRIVYHVYRQVVLASLAECKKMELQQILEMVSCDPSHNARRVYTAAHGPQIVSLLSPSAGNFDNPQPSTEKEDTE